MHLFIVIGFIDYEDCPLWGPKKEIKRWLIVRDMVQGVYSTRKQAIAAEERIKDSYDSTSIFKIEVDKDEEINV